ncbi:hypothetical protein FRB98_004495 [Tulasnella sp. 332]|nr:hypothetical protein FRB98_004495 [Tulasnella sp. 332]
MFALRFITGARSPVTVTGGTKYYTPLSTPVLEEQTPASSHQSTIASIDSAAPPVTEPISIPEPEPQTLQNPASLHSPPSGTEVSLTPETPIDQLTERDRPIIASELIATPEQTKSIPKTEACVAAITGIFSSISFSQNTPTTLPTSSDIEQEEVKKQDTSNQNNGTHQLLLQSSIPDAPSQELTVSDTMPQSAANVAPAPGGMTDKQMSNIAKAEGKHAKALSKVIQNEVKADAKLLSMAMKDLTNLQKIETKAISNEAAALKAHTQAVKSENKINRAYLDAKAKWEIAAAELAAKTEQLESCRRHSQEQTAALKAKTKEVEDLRTRKATDDRERQTKLAALSQAG